MLKVASALHFVADLTLDLGEVVYDYLAIATLVPLRAAPYFSTYVFQHTEHLSQKVDHVF